MKKALVISMLVVAGLGLAAFAGPFSGTWSTCVAFDMSADDITFYDTCGFNSWLDLNFETCGWNFHSFSYFGQFTTAGLNGWLTQRFQASGSVGAFSGFSYLDFTPGVGDDAKFNQWLSGVDISIAGVELYAYFDVELYNYCLGDPGVRTWTDDIGSGGLVGVKGVAGDCTIQAEALFNLSSYATFGEIDPWVGYTFGDFLAYAGASAFVDNCLRGCASMTIADEAFNIVQTDCCVCWSGAHVEVAFPFACVETVKLYANFSCDAGFDYFRVNLNDIDSGVCCGWLMIDDIDIRWKLQTKSVVKVDIDFVVGDTCITPYFAINPTAAYGNSGYLLENIALYAFGLDYNWNGLQFYSITLLDTTNYTLAWDGSVSRVDLVAVDDSCLWGPGAQVYVCPNDYDELFRICADADSCCGGMFSFCVDNWFDIDGDTTGIFGWMETEVKLSFGVGSGITLSTDFSVTATALNFWQICMGVVF